MASELGLKGTGKMRKSDLIEAIKGKQAPSNGERSTAKSQGAPAKRREARTATAPAEAAAPVASPAPAEAAAPDAGSPATEVQADRSSGQDAAGSERGRGRGRGRQSSRGNATEGDNAPAASEEVAESRSSERTADDGQAERGNRKDRSDRNRRDDRNERTDRSERRDERTDRNERSNRRDDDGDSESNDRDRGNRKDRGGRNDRGNRRDENNDRRDENSNRRDENSNRRDDDGDGDSGDRNDRGDRGNRRNGRRDENSNRRDDDDRGNRRGRSRVRDRKRRGNRGPDNYEDVEIREDDILLPVAGILDVHDSYAFVRTSGYLPGPNDVYVSMGQIKKNGLRKGDALVGAVKQPVENDGGNQRQKFNALVRLDSVNGLPVEDAKRRVEFGKLTPLYPQERLRLETESKIVSTRIIDLVAPIGKGQRGLIVSPPKAGKTMIMQQIANAISTNNPEVHLMVVLVDERPEEVTDMQRAVKGEVIASTFDRPAEDHTTIAELAIERAKRLVEMGTDVVVLLDNMTRLGRAYNLAQPASGRILSGGVDANALYPPKRFFGAARNIEGGGSLTIMATALVETGSKMDEVIFEEFKGTGNMELRLSRALAEKRIYPAVDVNASSTRREENLMSAEETKIMWKLRRVLSGLEQQQAVELLLGKIKETSSNVEFLMQVQKTTPLPGSAADD
ncbi:transcription termination factor Rho [Saxibacter everestensis]|uniref:Transcription termination factor Rho n=2 Tax=Saxibacter everestensis TaxID=2909229 RepID=A0ABY8R037_9MICO|nr:transcription termination factor Rho [Brevibacteriaceae bacterium ZFBP1038]